MSVKQKMAHIPTGDETLTLWVTLNRKSIGHFTYKDRLSSHTPQTRVARESHAREHAAELRKKQALVTDDAGNVLIAAQLAGFLHINHTSSLAALGGDVWGWPSPKSDTQIPSRCDGSRGTFRPAVSLLTAEWREWTLWQEKNRVNQSVWWV